MHIGEPKTGTSFLQRALWGNRARLAAQGVTLPGYSHRDHNRASRDLREAPREASDPSDPWAGEWDVLTGQALRAPGVAVISDEILAACHPGQADRAVRSLLAADVHVILTVRDFATVLPAEWQERVKCRGTAPWADWLDEVASAAPAADRRKRSWFWAVHDTLAILGMWSQHIPPDHVHVITLPPCGPADVLWARFASVLGIDPGPADLAGAHLNPSLGPAEAEFLRQVNEALPADVPDWFYTRDIKRILALDLLRARPAQAPLALPPGRAGWVLDQSAILVEGLRDAKYDIVGDLGELVPQPDRLAGGDASCTGMPLSQAAGQAAGRAAGEAAGHAAGQLVDAAVHATAALLHHMYLEQTGSAARPPRPAAGLRQLPSRWEWTVLNGAWTRRVLRRASHRPSVRWVRVLIWRVLMRPAAQQR